MIFKQRLYLRKLNDRLIAISRIAEILVDKEFKFYTFNEIANRFSKTVDVLMTYDK